MSIILVVDDQPAVRTALELLFDVHGLAVETAASPKEALARVERGGVGLVVQDMNYASNATSGEEGVALFRAIRARAPRMPVVLLTAWTSLETAVQLVKEGAADYLSKPWDDDKLVATVRTLLELHALQLENARIHEEKARARDELASRHALCGLIYESEAMHRLVSLAAQVARADVPVLITGPNGSGKEKIAEIIQANSRRAQRPLVKVDAGALADNLLEAELFGAEPGAFTGAQKLRVGRFEAADGGTIFLDEIGNLSANGQMKLLRVLQSGELQRLGSNVTRTVDVRVVSATNVDLPAAIAARTFREDLYFRLNVIELRVPPLVERRDDVLPLARFFLDRYAERGEGGGTPTLADDARAALLAHHWPGNVRELANRIQRAALLCQGGIVRRDDLGFEPPRAATSSAPAARASSPSAPSPIPAPASMPPSDDLAIDKIDRATLEAALERADGNVSRAAAELGLSRQALYRRMDRLGLSFERKLRR
jgi:DNA-binding NtrC family response regulator